MRIRIKQCVKVGYIEMDSGGVADLSYPSSELRRGRVQENGWIVPTLTCNIGIHRITKEVRHIVEGTKKIKKILYYIRRLTPWECFALMGMEKSHVDKALAASISESALYKQAGNGIVADCIELIGEHIIKSYYDSTHVCTDEIMREKQGITAEKLDKALYYEK